MVKGVVSKRLVSLDYNMYKFKKETGLNRLDFFKVQKFQMIPQV